MEILRAELADADALLGLQRLAYHSEAVLYNNFQIPPLTQTLDELRAEFATHIVLKMVEAAQIIGSVRAFEHAGACHIGRLIVHPAWQHRGIGTALMGEIEACYPHAAVYRLFTGSRSDGNIRLYERLGYRHVRSERVSAQLTLVHMENPGNNG